MSFSAKNIVTARLTTRQVELVVARRADADAAAAGEKVAETRAVGQARPVQLPEAGATAQLCT